MHGLNRLLFTWGEVKQVQNHTLEKKEKKIEKANFQASHSVCVWAGISDTVAEHSVFGGIR